MNLANLRHLAERHQHMRWTGMVLPTEDVLQVIALAECGAAAQQCCALARQALGAWNEHDLARIRSLLLAIVALEPDPNIVGP